MKKLIKKLIIIIKDISKKGFFHLLSARVLLRVLGFGSLIFVTKFLSPTELSQLRTMQSFTTIALVLAVFGFNTSVLKLCSEKRSLKEKSVIFKYNLKFSLISTSVVLLLLFLVAKLGILSPDQNINQMLPYFMMMIPASVIATMLTHYLQSLKQIKKMASIQIIFRVIGIVLLIILTYILGIWGYIISTVIIGYILLPFYYNFIKDFFVSSKQKISKIIQKQSLYLAKWSVAANAFQKVTRSMDILMLNFLILDRVEFGYYSLATLFLIPLSEVFQTIRSIALPYFSEKQNNREEFTRVLRKYRKLMLYQTFVLIVLSTAFIITVIYFFYEEQYRSAITYFIILVSGFLFRGANALLTTSLIAIGQMKYNFYSTTIYLPISFLLNYLLIINFGIIGAAIAQTSVKFLAMLIIIVISKKAINKHFDSVEQKIQQSENQN